MSRNSLLETGTISERSLHDKNIQTLFFLSVTWHLNQVSILVSCLFKTNWKKCRNIDFLEKNPKNKKKCIYFFSGEDIRIGEVFMHFFPVHVMQFNNSKR